MGNVKLLQHILNLKGFRDDDNNKLIEDGIAGVKTLEVCSKLKLGVGDKNDIVKWVQMSLINRGYSCGYFEADGIFGVHTKSAVESFKRDNKLIEDGIVDIECWKALVKVSNESVREIQKLLNSAGYTDERGESLVEDGIVGIKTLQASYKCILRLGSKGPIVFWLQRRLNNKGYSFSAYGIDGTFGKETFNVVESFQNDNKLVIDGIVGQHTWRTLLK